jgi:Ni2+-binding GTPase involved in maturation of urease and hydrogenase
VSLCVLSLEDLSSETIPHAIASRLDPSTLILLNKADLVPDAAFANRLLPENAKFWFASVKNESGMDTFLDGFVGELKAR